jgi:hypothetical protein
MNGSTGADPVEKALQVFVYAPIGFAVMALQSVPQLVGAVVSRVPNLDEAEARLASQLRQARVIGQFAVTYGSRQMRREVDLRLADARKRAEDLAGRLPGFGPDEEDDLLAGSVSPPPPARAAPAAAGTATARPPRPGAGKAPAGKPAAKRPARTPNAGDLPIPDYDELSASQVVSRLTGLTPAELAAVRAYEAAGRGRKTVLGAIDRLHQ